MTTLLALLAVTSTAGKIYLPGCIFSELIALLSFSFLNVATKFPYHHKWAATHVCQQKIAFPCLKDLSLSWIFRRVPQS